MVKEYFFVGGAEWLGPHNKHGALIAHAMFGGVYGDFQKDLLGQPPARFDFYNNQIAPAAIIGGHFDLNRSEHWVFRITPDAVMTHYSIQRRRRIRPAYVAVRRELRHLSGPGVQVHEDQAVDERRRTGCRAGRSESGCDRRRQLSSSSSCKSVRGARTGPEALRLLRPFSGS